MRVKTANKMEKKISEKEKALNRLARPTKSSQKKLSARASSKKKQSLKRLMLDNSPYILRPDQNAHQQKLFQSILETHEQKQTQGSTRDFTLKNKRISEVNPSQEASTTSINIYQMPEATF